MKNFEDKVNLFDQYTSKQLSEVEQKDFETQLKNDISFREDFKMYQDLVQGIVSSKKKEIKNIAREIINKTNKTANQKTIIMNNSTKSRSRMPLIAASLLLFAGAFYFFQSTKSNGFDADKVLADNYTSESIFVNDNLDNIGVAGFANPTDSISNNELSPEEVEAIKLAEQYRVDTLSMGLISFKKSKWLDAKKSLFKYIDRYPEPIADFQAALYHYAKANLNNGDYATAIKGYNNFLASPNIDTKLKQEAEYELALSHLQVDAEEAKKLITKISIDPGHKYHDFAKGFLTIM